MNSRLPGAESEMSTFSKNEDGPPTKLPDISRGHGLSELKTGGGIADIQSPITVGDSGQPESPMRRSFSPSKTFMSGSQGGRGTMTNFYFK